MIETKFCPICKKVLLQSMAGGIIDYFCQTRIKFGNKANVPHYELRDGDGPIWYAPPYRIRVSKNVSFIYEFVNDDLPMERFSPPEFKLLFEMNSQLPPDEPDKTAKRIKQLIIFS